MKATKSKRRTAGKPNTSFPPIRIAFFRDGKLDYIAEIPNPAKYYVEHWASLFPDDEPRLLPPVAVREPAKPSEVTYAVVDLNGAGVLERGLNRDEADGFAFGFNAEAEADKSPVRAAVILECDLPGESEVSHA